MSVLNRFLSDEINKIEETLNNNYINFKITYNETKKFYTISFNDSNTRDFLYMFSKLPPYIYYQYSKQRLNKNGFDTTLIAVWLDLRENPDYYQFRRLHDPIFTGIRIPFNKSDNFLSTYKNALLDLLKNNERDLTPIKFIITPILTFKNIFPATHFDFTSFVEYTGDYWLDLSLYLKRPVPLEGNKYYGYIGSPRSLFQNQTQETVNEFTESNFSEFWDNNTQNFAGGEYDITYSTSGIEEIKPKNKKEVNQNKNKTFKNEQCVICTEKQPNMLFCNCGHLCMCNTCFIVYDKDQCPICKTENTNIREI